MPAPVPPVPAAETQELTAAQFALVPGGFFPEHLDVHARLARLRPAYQRVLELRFFAGFTLEETAAELALSMGTVKTHQRQALRQLSGLWR